MDQKLSSLLLVENGDGRGGGKREIPYFDLEKVSPSQIYPKIISVEEGGGGEREGVHLVENPAVSHGRP